MRFVATKDFGARKERLVAFSRGSCFATIHIYITIHIISGLITRHLMNDGDAVVTSAGVPTTSATCDHPSSGSPDPRRDERPLTSAL